ncbi:MAG: hypothetical protein HY423_09965 [Candidatus Lambdaproteobacteria bacterium]|nr:hypothetical protein [Candidatus Lambdaproteobacteria bacterium]
MVTRTVPRTLVALRRRFLTEEPAKVTDWLWGEHPQTAAFVLNWLGEQGLARQYLQALSAAQQADVLSRISYLEPEDNPNPLQEELLVDALRQISPTLRQVGEELSREEPSARRGLALVQALLNLLSAEEFQELTTQLEVRDRNLARLCHSHYAVQRGGAVPGQEKTNIYGLLNVYSDFVSFHLNRFLSVRSLVYVESVELLSPGALEDRLLPNGLSFRFNDSLARAPFYMQITPRLLYHYLELAFGASRPYLMANFEKPEFTPTEQQIALSLADTLGRFLGQTLQPQGEPDAFKPETLEPGALVRALQGQRGRAVLLGALVVKLAQTTAGRILLLFPPSALLEGVAELPLGVSAPTLVQAPPAEPRRRAAGKPRATPADRIAADLGEDEGEPDDEGYGDEELLRSDLEDLLWRDELEEAERLKPEPEAAGAAALDFLLRGYAPTDTAALLGEPDAGDAGQAALHHFYGNELFHHDHHAEAAAAFERALAGDPSLDHARLLLAVAWGEQGFYFKEVIAYKRLIDEKKCLPEAHVLLARRLSFLGKVSEAFASLRDGIAMGYDAQRAVESDPCFMALRRSPQWHSYQAYPHD